MLLGGILAVMAMLAWGRLRAQATRVTTTATGHGAAASRQNGGLRVTTANIAHGRGGGLGASVWDAGGRPEIVERIGMLARELSWADLLVLQEVDFDCPWSHRLDEADVMAEAGGYPYVARLRSIDAGVSPLRAAFGIAVLSRYPLGDVEAIPLPPYSRLEAMLAGNHDALAVAFDVPGRGRVRLVALHLEVRSRPIRIAAARRIVAWMKARSGPFLVMGDLNSTLGPAPQAPEQAGGGAVDLMLRDGRLSAGAQLPLRPVGLTFPSVKPDRTIDWILASPPLRVETAEVVPTRLTDHLPVRARVWWPRTDRGHIRH